MNSKNNCEKIDCHNCIHRNNNNAAIQGTICWECAEDANRYDPYPYWELDDMYFLHEVDEDEI